MEKASTFDISPWIEHLKHPLILIGFGLFVLALLLKPLMSNGDKKLSGRATERLMNKAINFTFILALLVIIAGFVLSLNPDLVGNTKNAKNTKNAENTTPTTKTIKADQYVSGKNATAISAGGNVNHNEGNGVLSSKEKQNPASANINMTVKQNVTGEGSTAISAGGDVNVNKK